MNNPLNRFRLMLDYLAPRARCRGMPLCCSIEVTSRCNLNCTMCDRAKLNRPNRDMDRNLFNDIVDDGREFLELVYLNGGGESTLHPELPAFIERCTRNGIKTQLPTNGTLLTRDLINDLLGARVSQILVGMEGATRETYERVRKGASYDQVCENLRTLAELNHETGNRTSVVVQMVMLGENRHEANALAAQWRIPGLDGVRFKRDERPMAENLPPKPASSVPRRYRCLFAWQGPLWINAAGDLIRHGFGHSDDALCRPAYDETLCEGFPLRDWQRIFNGPEMISFRQNHIDGKFAACGVCETCEAYGPPPQTAWMTFLPGQAWLKLSMHRIERYTRRITFLQSSLP